WGQEAGMIPGDPVGFPFRTRTERLGEVRAVLALNLIEGSFPRRRREEAVLGDEDRRAIAEITQGRVALELSAMTSAAERDEWVRLCAAPDHTLVLSHSVGKGEAVTGLYPNEAARLARGLEDRELPAGAWCPPPERRRLPVDHEFGRALEQEEVAPPLERLTLPELRSRLRPDLSAGITTREAASAAFCAFKSFAQHRLELEPAGRPSALLGLRNLAERAELALFDDPESAAAGLEAAYDELLERDRGRMESWELRLLQKVRPAHIRRLVRQEFEARKVLRRNRPHGPVLLSEIWPDPVKLAGHPVRFRDSIAWIDIIDDLVLVSSPSFGPGLPNDSKDEHLFDLTEPLLAALLRAAVLRKAHPSHSLGLVSTSDSKKRVLNLTHGQEPLHKNSQVTVYANPRVRDESQQRDPIATAAAVQFVKPGIEALNRTEMEATPGLHCSHCGFGEACRVSAAIIRSSEGRP
ncbi:MAG: hypothetical protein MH204_05470, partial [Fimbriimonadaceae bacterium]|nr:hypothetical protein [Fimbriimonadaceae bacterium]